MKQFSTIEIEKILQKYLRGEETTRKEKIFYRNIENTLNGDIIKIYTTEELLELHKCANDIFYFIEKYCNIKLYSYQMDIINGFINNKFIINCNSLQIGYTRLVAAYYLHYCIFNTNKNITIIFNKKIIGNEFIDIVWSLYLKLPYFVKPGLYIKTHNLFIFNNGNKLNTIYPSKILIGESIDILHIYDFANILLFNQTEFNINTYINNLSIDYKIIISSCPNGFNEFYNLICNSERKENDPKKNLFKTIKTYWWEVPNRGEEWKQNEIKIMGEAEFNRCYDLCFYSI